MPFKDSMLYTYISRLYKENTSWSLVNKIKALVFFLNLIEFFFSVTTDVEQFHFYTTTLTKTQQKKYLLTTNSLLFMI